MRSIRLLDNPLLDYAWGSTTALPELLGLDNPEGRPLAEMWMGAHPKAPSSVLVGQTPTPLTELLRAEPRELLGEDASRFEGRFPFLLKVLAAEVPLSIQAHPGPAHAAAGFARENAAGLALDAPERCYRDPWHKPEVICALTPFWALNGFRPIPELLDALGGLAAPALAEPLARFAREGGTAGLREFFGFLLTRPPEVQDAIVEQAVAASRHERSPRARWLRRLHELHPGDVGALAALLLNLVRLEPGEAMYLPDGQLHAYLHGVGIELMANSDNVLRGGLTSKHVDVNELLGVLGFTDGAVPILSAEPLAAGERVYRTPAREFRLSVVDVAADEPYRATARASVEILLCVEGAVRLRGEDGSTLDLRRGASALVPAAAPAYGLEGRGRVYRATVPPPG